MITSLMFVNNKNKIKFPTIITVSISMILICQSQAVINHCRYQDRWPYVCLRIMI